MSSEERSPNNSDDDNTQHALSARVKNDKMICKRKTQLDHYSSLLIDIEGTTTPILFVKEVMFPYIRVNLSLYLETHFDSTSCKEAISDLAALAVKDLEEGVSAPTINIDEKKSVVIEQVLKNVFWQMDQDRKSTALKRLQGDVWKDGFEKEELKGEVYPDVVPALKCWRNKNIKLFIYSSGSVAAQRLLFGHTQEKDLLNYFSGHFDTKIGSKIEGGSYEKIASEIGEKVGNILFLTDNIKEARAAKLANVDSVLLVRPGNEPLTDGDRLEFVCVNSFKEVSVDKSFSRKLPKTEA